MRHFVELIANNGLPFVFLCVLVEQGGLPIPAYPVMLVAAALLAGTATGPYEIVAVAVSAALIADLCWYFGGRRYGNRVLSALCRLSLSPDYCVRQTRTIYNRWGPASLTFAKFIPGFASLATALAGTTRTRLPTFLFFDTIGATLWAGVAVALGLIFQDAIDDVLAVLASLGKWGSIFVLSVLVLYIARRWWSRWNFARRLRMDRITVAELVSMIAAGDPPVILDVRASDVQRSDGRIPGAITVNVSVGANLPELPPNKQIVIYCACPNEASAAQLARRLLDGGLKRVRPLHGGIDAWVSAGQRLEGA